MEKLNDSVRVIHLVIATLSLLVTIGVAGCGYHANLLDKLSRQADAVESRSYPRAAGERVESSLDRMEGKLDDVLGRVREIEGKLKR